MAKPLRLEFAGALYHITARGDGREDIYCSDAERVGHVFQGRYKAILVEEYERQSGSRDEAVFKAYHSGGYKMVELADYFGLHYSSISKIIRKIENSQFKT